MRPFRCVAASLRTELAASGPPCPPLPMALRAASLHPSRLAPGASAGRLEVRRARYDRDWNRRCNREGPRWQNKRARVQLWQWTGGTRRIDTSTVQGIAKPRKTARTWQVSTTGDAAGASEGSRCTANPADSDHVPNVPPRHHALARPRPRRRRAPAVVLHHRSGQRPRQRPWPVPWPPPPLAIPRRPAVAAAIAARLASRPPAPLDLCPALAPAERDVLDISTTSPGPITTTPLSRCSRAVAVGASDGCGESPRSGTRVKSSFTHCETHPRHACLLCRYPSPVLPSLPFPPSLPPPRPPRPPRWASPSPPAPAHMTRTRLLNFNEQSLATGEWLGSSYPLPLS